MKLTSVQCSSSAFGTDLSQFLTTDDFSVCDSDGSSCDLFSEEDNVSDVCNTNEIVVKLREASTSEETEKKSVLSNFLSRFKCGPKTTKARKIYPRLLCLITFFSIPFL